MPKVRLEDVEDAEELEQELDDESIEQGVEKFSRIKRTKMKDELARYKNKKQNKGRERDKQNS